MEPSPIEETKVHTIQPLSRYLQQTLPKLGSRIVIIRTIQFAERDGQPISQELNSRREVISSMQPYGPRRSIEVGEKWESLDLGWFRLDNKLHEIGELAITNQEGKFTQIIPTPQEKQEALLKVLELGIKSDFDPSQSPTSFALIPASQDGFTLQHHEFIPSDPKQVMIRCRMGIAKYSITVYPK